MANLLCHLESDQRQFGYPTRVTKFDTWYKPDIRISTPATEPEATKASNSIIDEWLTMRGDLESEGDILVKGKVHGNIRCKLLIVDEKASIEGGLIADEVVVRGSISGEIRAMRVRLEESAVVDSAIYHRSFSVAEGAQIKGALHFEDDPLSGAPSLSGKDEKSAPLASKSASAADKSSKDAVINGSSVTH